MAMEKYGIDNVRGGSYCKINLTKHEKDKALQIIRSVSDKCYKCGKKGHFSKNCNAGINASRHNLPVQGQGNYKKSLCNCGDSYNNCKCIIENNTFLKNLPHRDKSDSGSQPGLVLLVTNQLDYFIRIILGQKIFPTPVSPDEKKCIKGENNYCDKCQNCKYRQWYDDEWEENGHLSFDFNAREDIDYNKQIIDLFNNMLRDNKLIVHTKVMYMHSL